jgi:hypothetical protein
MEYFTEYLEDSVLSAKVGKKKKPSSGLCGKKKLSERLVPMSCGKIRFES